MEDREVIEAFVREGARQAFGPTLHIEGDVLLLAGWWHAAFRLSQDAFILRNEEPPETPVILQQVAEELAARGLRQVGVDLPAITAITYAELSLGSVSWAVWAPNLASGELALATRSAGDSFLAEGPLESSDAESVELLPVAGARRLAGLPPGLVLTVGLGTALVEELRTGLPECTFVCKRFGEVSPDACGTLIPTLVVVDATEPTGREFVMELRADACGRFIPVAALSPGPDIPLGADVALDPGEPPTAWVDPLRRLLP